MKNAAVFKSKQSMWEPAEQIQICHHLNFFPIPVSTLWHHLDAMLYILFGIEVSLGAEP